MEYKPGDKIRLKQDDCLGVISGKKGQIIRKLHPSEITIVDYIAGSTCVYCVHVPSYGEACVLDGFIENVI